MNVSVESKEISLLFSNSALRLQSSVALGWSGFAIERRIADPAEKPEVLLDHHFLILWDDPIAEGEMAYRSGQFAPYRKFRNTITTCLPGIRPATRSLSKHEVIVCAMQPKFVSEIEEELDKRPLGSLRPLYGASDPPLSHLVLLLLAEAEGGGQFGALYADSLATAITTRLIHTARLAQPQSQKASALPRHALRRVVEFMRENLDAQLNLQTLAKESGYSRSHFLQMFQAATGQTPHRYLLGMRLEKARTLMTKRSIRLIDVAALCGFSSPANFSTAFRSQYGFTPSLYRRNLRLPAADDELNAAQRANVHIGLDSDEG
jgi:AraC family transcriptional regulator